MRKKTTRLRTILFDQGTAWLLPLSFTLPSLVNFVCYYLGLALEENIGRSASFVAANVILAVIAGLTWLCYIRKHKFSWRTLALSIFLMIFFLGCYVAWLLKFGPGGLFLTNISQFIVFSIPALFCGMIAASGRLEKSFFENVEKLSVLILPGAIIYLNGAIFQCNPFNYGRNFGIMSYMTFAYALMPFFLVHILRFCDRAPLPVLGQIKPLPHPQLIRGILIAVYWYAILASGTRGTYVCCIGFAMLLLISRWIHRENIKAAAVIFLSMVMILSISLFLFTLPGLKQVGRMTMFVEGLRSGQLVTSEQNTDVDSYIGDLIAADGGHQVANRPLDETEMSEGIETPAYTDIAEQNLQIGSRGTMYKISFGEFLKSPLTGMGPGGYGVKYGSYPHNIVLELLCETGLAGSIPMFALILTAIVRLLLAGWRRKEVRWMLLFFMAYAIEANISGSVWKFAPLLCALGYGLTVSIQKTSTEDSNAMERE